MNTQLSTTTQPTMSSLEIAKLTEKRHDNVMADIRKILEEMGEGGVLKFQDTYVNEQNGQTYPCFNLPRRECDVVIAGYSVPYRVKIIDRWQELEKANKPKSKIEWIQQCLAAEIENERLLLELDKSKQWFTIKRVAKHNNLDWSTFNWRKLKAASLLAGHPAQKIFDANYGEVNTYHAEAFKTVYPDLIMPEVE